MVCVPGREADDAVLLQVFVDAGLAPGQQVVEVEPQDGALADVPARIQVQHAPARFVDALVDAAAHPVLGQVAGIEAQFDRQRLCCLPFVFQFLGNANSLLRLLSLVSPFRLEFREFL